MKNKGFTLVELLAIIGVLGVITLITIPTVDNVIKKNKEKLFKDQIETIRNGLKTWGDGNVEELPEKSGDIITLNLGQLKSAGFVQADLKNPKTKECFANDMKLYIKKVNENYEYIIDFESASEPTASDCNVGSDYIKEEPSNLYIRTEFNGLWQDTIDIDWNTQYVEIQFDSNPIIDDFFMGHEFFIIMLGTSTNKFVEEISALEDGSTYHIFANSVRQDVTGIPCTNDVLKLSKAKGFELLNDGEVVGTFNDSLGITSSSKLVLGNQIGEGTGHTRYGNLPLIRIEVKNL